MTLPEAFPPDEEGSFLSGDVPIRLDVYFPPGARTDATRGPGVLLLHGAEGLGFSHAYRAGARSLAADGLTVGLVQYLDRTAERRVTFARIAAHFPRWIEAVRDGLGVFGSRPEIDPARLGLVGISLGATLALQIAAEDARVRAVVDFFGPLPQHVEGLALLAPTLVLHGERDSLVPASHGRRLVALLEARGTPHESRFFEDQGHGFHGDASSEASALVAAFLRRWL